MAQNELFTMKIYLHIGSPKTGTTSIQKFLQCNREALLSKHGLWVSELFGNKTANHGVLNIASANIDRLTPAKAHFLTNHTTVELLDFRKQLYREIVNDLEKAAQANCSATILSNEGLYFLDSVDEYDRLSSLFGYLELTVILVTRNVEAFKQSYKQQLITGKLGFSEHPECYNYVNDDSYLFDYERKTDMLKLAFKQLEIISYDRAMQEDGGITPAFLKSLNIEMNDIKEFFVNRT